MNAPDLSSLAEGSIFGISMYGAVRQVAIVERVSNGIIRARAINGQYPIAFAVDEPSSGLPAHRRADNWRDAAMLCGDWAKGMEIAFVGDIPEEHREVLVRADEAMRGKSYGDIKRIYESIGDTYRATLAFMNESIEFDQQPMQMAM